MIRFLCGGDEREVGVTARPSGLRVTVDGSPFDVDLEPVAPNVFFLRHGEGGQTFHCAVAGSKIHLFWKGVAYVLERVEEGARPAARHGPERLEAPMPGRVIAVRVTPGQPVARGEELLVIEAMKMENSLRAPHDGVVASVAAKVGDMVGPGTVLVELQ
jgi:3-methylcrotonyl-CoA carboxylase alpha subunit